MSGRTASIFVSLALLVALGGFYLVLSEIADLRGEIETIKIIADRSASETATVLADLRDPLRGREQTSSSEDAGGVGAEDGGKLVSVPALISLNVLSSPRLEPQANLGVAVEAVSKDAAGWIRVTIRVSTAEAASYSAFEARDFFELVDLEAGNQRPVGASPAFASLPPGSITTGTVDFRVNPTAETVILQVGGSENAAHYEFNFKTRSYKKVVLG